jgi:hypothetical protein
MEEAIAALPDEPSPQMGLFDPREASDARNGETGNLPTSSASEIVAANIETPTAAILAPPPAEPAPVVLDPAHLPYPAERVYIADSSGASSPAAPAFLTPPPPRGKFTLVWLLLSLIAFAGLAVQATLHFRSEIAVLLPVVRTHLETACDMFGCDLRLPRRADLMSIESSDLQADTQRKGVIILNALLRNRAPFPQEYPELELTLTDQSDRAVIRKVLKPGEYLQQKAGSLAQGISGGAEEAVRIYLETSNAPATGYQLFLFYPCPRLSTNAFWQLSYPSRCQDSRNK